MKSDVISSKTCFLSQEEQIHKEYKIRALELHPDKNIENEEACDEFQKLKKAKEVLLDKEKRMLYDRWLLAGIMMSFDQFINYTKNNCQSFHWASKKPDPMLTCNDNSTSQMSKATLERKNSKLNLKDTPVFRSNQSVRSTNDFIWTRNETNDLLKKFRNYEI